LRSLKLRLIGLRPPGARAAGWFTPSRRSHWWYHEASVSL